MKFSILSLCHPGSRAAAHEGSVGLFPRTSMEEGVRWNTNSWPAEAATCGMTCTAVAPVPMMPTRLSPNLSMDSTGLPPV